MKQQNRRSVPKNDEARAHDRRKPWAAPKLTVQSVEALTNATFNGAIFDGSFTS